MTSFITPNPGIHTFPKLDSTQFTIQDFDQLVAWGQQLLYGIANWIVLALDNISVLGIHPFVQLQAFGQQVAAAVAQLEALINGIGGTAIADVVAAIELAQRIIDDIVKLLTGGTGSNYALTDLNAALQSIPGGFINGITGIEQNILDAIANALGHGGTGHTVSQIQNYLANIPVSVIESIFGNANLGADVQQIVTSINTALGFVNGITGTISTDINDIENALKKIPGANMLPQLGGANIADDIQQWANTFVANIGNEATGTLAAIRNAWPHFSGNVIGYQPSNPNVGSSGSVFALAQTQQGFQQGQATSKSLSLNIDPSVDGVFNLSSVANNSTLPSVTVTQGNSVIGFILTPDGTASAPAPKVDVAWIGYPKTSGGTAGSFSDITAMSVNVYAMNTTTGAMTLSQSINIVNPAATLPAPTSFNPSSGSSWYYQPLNTTISVQQGQVYAVELSVTGPGSYVLAGLTNAIPVHPTVLPKQWGASRTAAPTINFGATLSVASYGASVAVPVIGNTPSYNSTGAGYSQTTSASSLTASYTHTIASGMGTGVVIVYVITDNGYVSNYTTAGAVKYGGANTTYLYSVGFNNNGNYGAIYAYGITGITSSGTVAMSLTYSASVPAARIQSVAYGNATGFGSVVTNYWGAVTAATSGSVATAQTQMVSQCFAAEQGSTVTFSAYTPTGTTSRENSTAVNGTAHLAWVIGDTPVASPPSSALAPGTGTSPFAYSTTTPWFGLSGTNPTPSYPPELTTFSTAGTFTFTPPVWANKLDVVVVGGGGGASSTTLKGGGAGSWNAVTWAAGMSTVAVTVGAGGAVNTAGGSSSATATGRTTVSGAGGTAGGTTQAVSVALSLGDTPGNQSFDGNVYYGGAVSGSIGNSPGGGGGASSAFSYAYAGAPGAVFILAYQ